MPPAPIDRTALRHAFRIDEEACIAERLRQAAPASALQPEAAELAARLIEGARKRKAAGLDAFLQSYGLATEEGIALMCLAEALLRVPDAETADALIHDKLAGIDWGEHLGESSSTFVNAATFSLMLTGELVVDQRVGGLGVGHAQQRLGKAHQRDAFLGAETVGGEERVEPAGLASARAFDQPRGERGGVDMNCRGGRGLAQPLFDAGAFLLAVNGTQRKAVDHGAPLHPVSAVINPLIPERIAVALDVARRSAPEVRREA